MLKSIIVALIFGFGGFAVFSVADLLNKDKISVRFNAAIGIACGALAVASL